MPAVSQEIESLRQMLRRFMTEEVIPLQHEHGLSGDEAPPRNLRGTVRRRSKELGLYAPDMPVDVGGGGISFSDRGVLEMDVHSYDTVFFDDILGGPGGPTSILLACNDEQRRRYLQPRCRANSRPASRCRRRMRAPMRPRC